MRPHGELTTHPTLHTHHQNSTASADKFKEYLKKRFRPEIAIVYSSLFFDIIPALGRGGAKASMKVRRVSFFGGGACTATRLV